MVLSFEDRDRDTFILFRAFVYTLFVCFIIVEPILFQLLFLSSCYVPFSSETKTRIMAFSTASDTAGPLPPETCPAFRSTETKICFLNRCATKEIYQTVISDQGWCPPNRWDRDNDKGSLLVRNRVVPETGIDGYPCRL